MRAAIPLRCVASVLGVLFCSTLAWAGNGLMPTAMGAKDAGRGGTTTSAGGDAFSVAENPAFVTDFDRIRLSVSMLILLERVRERDIFGLNDLDEGIIPLPYIGVAGFDPFGDVDSPEGPSDFRLGFGFYAPFVGVFSPTVTVGLRLTPELSIGASVNGLFTYMNIKSRGSMGGPSSGGEPDFLPGGDVFVYRQADGTPVNPPQPFTANTGTQVTWAEIFRLTSSGPSSGSSGEEGVTLLEINDLYGMGLSGQLGLLWRPHDQLSIGLSVRTPGYIFNPSGTGKLMLDAAVNELKQDPQVGALLGALIETYLPNGGAQGLSATYDIEADHLVLPPVASIGISFWPHDSFMVSLDLRWIGWSFGFDEISLKATGGQNADLNAINGSSTIRYTFRLDWEDQFVIGFGTAWAALDWMTVRAGFNYGKNPIPDSTITANALGVESHVTTGVTFYLGDWDLDVAYVYALPLEVSLPGEVFKAEQHALYLGVSYEF